ncbi:uncharacterized protein LOC134840123 isoform X2 [Symsagittifera roscoffensis]|uniref:uncharacterized protein LOC134840123 isoform X2 n=1 Tax=Symsagittifera roscoffensis TaxID=84072 RepID=UPI00307C5F8D
MNSVRLGFNSNASFASQNGSSINHQMNAPAVAQNQGHGQGGDDSDSDIEVLKEVMPVASRESRKNPQIAPKPTNQSGAIRPHHCSSGKPRYQNPSSNPNATRVSPVGANSYSFYTGASRGTPTIQILNGSYESSQPATQVNIQMTPIILNQQQQLRSPPSSAGNMHMMQQPPRGKNLPSPNASTYYSQSHATHSTAAANNVQFKQNQSRNSLSNETYQCNQTNNKSANSSSSSSAVQVQRQQEKQANSSSDQTALWSKVHKLLASGRYTRETVLSIVKEKGLNCFYAVRNDRTAIQSPYKNGQNNDVMNLFKCCFFETSDSRFCDENFSVNMLYMNHIDSHFWKSEFLQPDIHTTTCKSCFMRFPNHETLRTHVDFFHSNVVDHKGNSHACQICDYTFSKSEIYMRHMFELHEVCETPYKCRICNFATSFYAQLVSHFRNEHQNSKYFLCRFCFGVFTTPELFCEHMRDHLPRKNNVKCTKCRLIFVKQSSLPTTGDSLSEAGNQADHLRYHHQGLAKLTQEDMYSVMNSNAAPQMIMNNSTFSQNSVARSQQPREQLPANQGISLGFQNSISRPPTQPNIQRIPGQLFGNQNRRPSLPASTWEPNSIAQTVNRVASQGYNHFQNSQSKERAQIVANNLMERYEKHGYARRNQFARAPVPYNPTRFERPSVPVRPMHALPQMPTPVSQQAYRPPRQQPYQSLQLQNQTQQQFTGVAQLPRTGRPSSVVQPTNQTKGLNNTKYAKSTPDIMVTVKPGWTLFLKFDGGFAKVRGKMNLWRAGLLERCLECGSYVNEPNRHFTKLMDCKLCPYSTYCPRAAINHFGTKHGLSKWTTNLNTQPDSMFTDLDCKLDDGEKMKCFCGFESESGTKFASHVYFCRFGECDLPQKDKTVSLPDGGTMKHNNEKFTIKCLPSCAVAISSLGKSYTERPKKRIKAGYVRSNCNSSVQIQPSPSKSVLPEVPNVVAEYNALQMRGNHSLETPGFSKYESQATWKSNTSVEVAKATKTKPRIPSVKGPDIEAITTSEFTRLSKQVDVNSSKTVHNTTQPSEETCENQLEASYDDLLPVPGDGMDSNEFAIIVPEAAPLNVNVLTGKEEQPIYPMDMFMVPARQEDDSPNKSRDQECGTVAQSPDSQDDIEVVHEVSPLFDAVSVLPAELRIAVCDTFTPDKPSYEKKTKPEKSNDVQSVEKDLQTSLENGKPETIEKEMEVSQNSDKSDKEKNSLVAMIQETNAQQNEQKEDSTPEVLPTTKRTVVGGFLASCLSSVPPSSHEQISAGPPKKKAKKGLDAMISNLLQKQTSAGS